VSRQASQGYWVEIDVRIDIKVTVAQCFSLTTHRRTYNQFAVGAGEVCGVAVC